MPTSFRQLAGIPDSVATVSDTILIFIDAQNEYVEGALSVDGISTSRPAIASLLERYRGSNGKIVHVKHEVPTGTPVFTPGTHLADEFEELKPAGGNDNEVTIMKKFPSSFAETELEDVLKKWSAKKLLLVGYMYVADAHSMSEQLLTDPAVFFNVAMDVGPTSAYPQPQETATSVAMTSW